MIGLQKGNMSEIPLHASHISAVTAQRKLATNYVLVPIALALET